MKKQIAAGVIATGAIALAYAYAVEPRWLQLKRVEVNVKSLPADLEGFTIGLLTDMHASDYRSLRLVRRARDILRSEGPDLIAITGDFVRKQNPVFAPVMEDLESLSAPHGVFAVPGNHDHLGGIEQWREEISRSSRLVDLTNRSVLMQVGRARLCVAGVDDLEHGDPDLAALPPVSDRDFTLLLAHNPEQAERTRRALDRIDLMVSGHTHAGQIRLPWMGPIRSSVQMRDLYDHGIRRRPWTQVYTSRGLGTVRLPFRFLARPEVTLIRLTGLPRQPWNADDQGRKRMVSRG